MDLCLLLKGLTLSSTKAEIFNEAYFCRTSAEQELRWRQFRGSRSLCHASGVVMGPLAHAWLLEQPTAE